MVMSNSHVHARGPSVGSVPREEVPGAPPVEPQLPPEEEPEPKTPEPPVREPEEEPVPA
jgi:hypothetical protein